MKTVLDYIAVHAKESPGHPAVVINSASGQDEEISYAMLFERVLACADRLIAAGAQPGMRCGMLASQGFPFIEAALGILQAQMCFVPISEGYLGTALDEFVQKTKLHMLLQESDDFAVKHYHNVGAVDHNEDKDFCSLSPAYIRFTSGTTNDRKGVLIGHRSILDRLSAANEVLKIGPTDRILWMLPMAHHFVVSILLYLRYGATILLPSSYLSKPILELANRREATIFYASPYHYDLLSKDDTELGLPNVRLAISTTSGLGIEIAEAFRKRMAVPLTQALGVIEIGLPIINMYRAAENPLSLGQVLPAYEVWLKGEDGKPVTSRGAEEGVGEIFIRGKGTFDAYLQPWLPASDVMQPNGFSTGDCGYFDENGDFFLQGRQHNRINMAGMKFFSEEVEAVLNQHPSVKESMVFGKPHNRLGEIPVARVIPNQTNSEFGLQEMIAWCKGKLADHKIPLELEIVNDFLRTATGKLKRW